MESQHKYENVSLEENDHDDLSTTEVGDSLMGDEKQWDVEDFQSRTRKSKRSTCMSILRSSRFFVDTILLLVILGLLLREQWQKGSVSGGMEVGGDITGVRPKFSTQITQFKINQTYAPYNTSEFFKPEVLDAWNQLMPKGMGFTWVNHTERYHDLPTPIRWPDKTVFTTSMTHQLHCLFAIVQTYSGLTSGHEIPDDHHWHMIHCFDYMRQAIMCSSDMALEGLEHTFPDHNGGSDGWDSKHICRDYTQVKSYLESVRAYDDQEIF